MQIEYGLRLIVEPAGMRLTAEERDVLRDLRPAGVMLRRRNLWFGAPSYREWLHEYRELIAELREATQRPNLLITVDHEGGRVVRFPEPITRFPYPAWYGSSVEAVELVTRASATELRALAINLLFWPTADIHSNPANPVIHHRAFGCTAAQVAECVSVCARSLRSEGILPCAKHFPGHGDTGVDSHVGLPVSDRSVAELFSRELVPFQRLVAEGIEAVMSAHIVLRQLDAVNPATVSQPILKGVLRSALGFQGVVIADALGMEAIRGDLSAEHFPLHAHRAGLDLFLVAGDTVSVLDAVRLRDGLRRGVEGGELSHDSMREAQARILALMAAAKVYSVEELPAQLFERHARSAEALQKHAPWEEFHFEPRGFE